VKRDGEDPPQVPAPSGFSESFHKSFQLTFFATSFVLIAFAALWVRIGRRLRRDRERNRNIIDVECVPHDPSKDSTDLTVR
jgi:hypothetical protein